MTKRKGLTGAQSAAVRLVFGGELGERILSEADAEPATRFKDRRAEQARSAARFWGSARLGSDDQNWRELREDARARRVRRAFGDFFKGGGR